GRRAFSRSRPTASTARSAKPLTPSMRPKTLSTEQYKPIETFGSPFSIRSKVGRLVLARSATTAADNRRRRRAARKSAPSFSNAFFGPTDKRCDCRVIVNYRYHQLGLMQAVVYIRQSQQSCFLVGTSDVAGASSS